MDLAELERRAREAVDPAAWDYYEGGADDEVTIADNVASWQRIRLRPRVLRDVSAVSTRTTVLGTEVPAPILVAPTAYHRLAHPEGELATARGAAAAGTVMIASTLSTTSLEEVAAAAPGAPRWFQLYVRKDRAWTAELVARAVDAGYRALVLTVDLPVVGFRPRDERNAFTLPDGMEMANLQAAVPKGEGSGLARYASDQLDASLTFDDLGWLKNQCGLPLLVKGVLRGDDAAACLDAGADGVVVSNHGGRQLDTALTGAGALPGVVEAVAGRAEVYVDGGIRRGTDVLKALAMGARAVLVGRPVLWGLAAGGADGVRGVMDGLAAATATTFALCGVANVEDLSADLIQLPGGSP